MRFMGAFRLRDLPPGQSLDVLAEDGSGLPASAPDAKRKLDFQP